MASECKLQTVDCSSYPETLRFYKHACLRKKTKVFKGTLDLKDEKLERLNKITLVKQTSFRRTHGLRESGLFFTVYKRTMSRDFRPLSLVIVKSL